MKIFIAYKYTGEDLAKVETSLRGIAESLKRAGHEAYYNFAKQKHYEEQGYSIKQIMEEAFEEIDASEALFAFVNSDQRSEGMLIEIGYAKAKGKRIIVAARKGSGVNTAKAMADGFMEFTEESDLCKEIENLKL